MLLWNAKRKTEQNGFTLIEVVIVFVILGVIAAIAIPSFFSFLPNMRLRSATRDVYSTMIAAKTEAMRRGENVTILFDAVNNDYRMFLDANANNLFDAGETVLVDAVTLPLDVSYDPTISVDGITFNSNTAIFSMRGIPLAGGTINLRSLDSDGNELRKRSVTVNLVGSVSTL